MGDDDDDDQEPKAMTEQVRNTGGPADGAVVTENAIIMQVEILQPQVPGALPGVLLRMGYPQQRVETLLDPEAAAALHDMLGQCLPHLRAMSSGLILPGMN